MEGIIMKQYKIFFSSILATVLFVTPFISSSNADSLPTHSQLKASLKAVVAEENGGFGFNMWATIVDRDGVVRALVFSGKDRGDQWPGSRTISAQKANTANAFSLPKFALSTANLFSAVQPGGSLFGLQFSNPVDIKVAYQGPSEDIGTKNDHMVGYKIGGVNVFGGGLSLYDAGGKLIGAIGVSGDSSCADHNIAWKVRHKLNLDNVPAGVSSTNDDNIVNDITSGTSSGGWGHPECSPKAVKIGKELPKTHPIGPKQ